MRAPLGWLREHVDVPAEASGADVAAALVRVGLEEEALHGGDVTGPVVVGRILTAEREPQKNGRTVSWCSVDVGEAEPRGIVCGAPNAVPGALVVVALPGAVLPGPFPIGARRTYGHVSDGMICSARELGLGDEHDGIIHLDALVGAPGDGGAGAAPGADAVALLGLAEEVVEVNVTPDRGYCLSMRGLAREYAHGAHLDVATAFRDPASPSGGAGDADLPGVDLPGIDLTGADLADDAPLEGREGCTRFVTRLVRGVDASAPSPWWMRRRLQQAGVRAINLAVDVTNYVMLDVGQPLHAYDAATLQGRLTVRRARAGEQLVTLDDVTRALHPQDLLIADGPGGARPVGLAGVMGGGATEVSASTTDVLVEAAHFDPVSIARTARRHRLPSEAGRRFERGVDPALQAAAAELAVRLLVEHGGGVADGGSDVRSPQWRRRGDPIALPVGLATRLVGVDLPAATVQALLEQVGCQVSADRGTRADQGQRADGARSGVLHVQPPSWRGDLRVGADLVEEVARLYGYAAIPSVLPAAPPGRGLTAVQRARRRVAAALADRGLVEVLTFPFVAPSRADDLGYAPDDPRRRAVRLTNPLSEQAPLMRTSVLATLVDAARRNVARGVGDVALFEVGRVTLPHVLPADAAPAPRPDTGSRPSPAEVAALEAAVPPQPVHLALLVGGAAETAGSWGAGRPADAFDAIAAARAAAWAAGVDLAVHAAELDPWHPGRCAALSLPDGTVVGHAGELHPSATEALGVPARSVAAELDLDALLAAAPAVVAAPVLSAYPLAKEDLALVVADTVPAEGVRRAMLEGIAEAGLGATVEDVRLFDVYTGAQIPPGSRSLAFAVRLRGADRTLTADDTAAVRGAALAGAARVGAVLRGA